MRTTFLHPSPCSDGSYPCFSTFALHLKSEKEYLSNQASIPKELQTTNKYYIKKKVYSSHSWADQIL